MPHRLKPCERLLRARDKCYGDGGMVDALAAWTGGAVPELALADLLLIAALLTAVAMAVIAIWGKF